MFSIRAGLRAIGRATFQSSSRTRTNPVVFNTGRLSRFQPKRFASQYSRFGQKSEGGKQQAQWSRIGPIYRVQYMWRNYQRPILVVTAGGGVFYVYNLEEVPVTGRRRFNIISPTTEKELFGGPDAYNAMLQEFQGKFLAPDHPWTIQVEKVVERLLPVTGGLAGDEWRVHVINEPEQANAFVMAGGKVFVFSGILPVCQDENGLAAVLSHEIGHNVAHHMAEKASRSGIIAIGAIALSLVLDVSGGFGNGIANLFLGLPNSRTQESEADHIGLLMMAAACYDPQAAVDMWIRMKEKAKGEPPQFLNTHPSTSSRSETIRKWLPEAQRIYEEKGCVSPGRHKIPFLEAVKTSQTMLPRQIRPRQSINEPRRRNESDDDDDFF